MTVEPMDERTIDEAFSRADRLMADRRWDEAESIIREFGYNRSDITLRMAQLEWRKMCIEYADELDWEELGRSGVRTELVKRFDIFAAEWVMDNYHR